MLSRASVCGLDSERYWCFCIHYIKHKINSNFPSLENILQEPSNHSSHKTIFPSKSDQFHLQPQNTPPPASLHPSFNFSSCLSSNRAILSQPPLDPSLIKSSSNSSNADLGSATEMTSSITRINATKTTKMTTSSSSPLISTRDAFVD
jgi:hypothetical protein